MADHARRQREDRTIRWTTVANWRGANEMAKAFNRLQTCGKAKGDVQPYSHGDMKTSRSLGTYASGAMCLVTFVVWLTFVQGSTSYAQAQDQSAAPAKVAKLNDPEKQIGR